MKTRRKTRLLPSVCCIFVLAAIMLCGCESLVIHVSEGTAGPTGPTGSSADTPPVTVLPDTPRGILPEDLTYDNSGCREAVAALRDFTTDSSTFMTAVSDGVTDTLVAEGSEIAPYYAERNEMAAEKYGCKIFGRTVPAGSLKKDLSASVKSGNDMTSYFSDILLVDAQTGGELGVSGLLLDLRKLPYYEYGTVGNGGAGMYNTFNRFCISALTHDITGTVLVFFNRDMAGQKASAELYSAVRNERFTFEYFLDFIKAHSAGADYDIAADLPDGSVFMADIAAVRSGYDFVNDADGIYPQLCEHTDGQTDALTKLVTALSSLRYYSGFTDSDPAGQTVFGSGKSLFFIGKASDIKEISSLRTSFGVVPLPVADDTEADGISGISASRPVICAPANNSRFELTGAMLTALNAATGNWIADAYINGLTAKYIRDNDSYYALTSALYEECYYDFSDIYGTSVKDLYNASYGAVRTCFNTGVPVGETEGKLRSAVNKALKSVK